MKNIAPADLRYDTCNTKLLIYLFCVISLITDILTFYFKEDTMKLTEKSFNNAL